MPVEFGVEELPDHMMKFDFVTDPDWGKCSCTCGDSFDFPKVEGDVQARDVIDAMKWAVEHFKELGVEPERTLPSDELLEGWLNSVP